MAEINDAYAALTREAAADRRVRDGERADFEAGPAPRRGRPATPEADPAGHRSRRHDRDVPPAHTSRNGASAAATGPAGVGSGWTRERAATVRRGTPLTGQPPLRGERVRGEPPRASTPTGPLERGRLRHFRRPKPPSLEAAREHVMEFGKFHGHTLGQIAGFEPSYIDWVAGTVTRDPDLVAAARVIQADLDAPRGRRAGRTRRRCGPVAPPEPAVSGPETADRPPIPEGDRCGGERYEPMIAAVPTSLRA